MAVLKIMGAISHFTQAFRWSAFTQIHVISDASSPQLICVLPSGDLAEECRPLCKSKRKTAPVDEGVSFLNEQTCRPPKLYATLFHPEPRFYGLLMVLDGYDGINRPNFSLFATFAGFRRAYADLIAKLHSRRTHSRSETIKQFRCTKGFAGTRSGLTHLCGGQSGIWRGVISGPHTIRKGVRG
ncbi:hypothetical protein EDB84DRAFT_1441449 [Lactarius hengduanensis]|nr:hypothetical protein EDB84DRAFT_1441449 [Lactarius hengduanensis]